MAWTEEERVLWTLRTEAGSPRLGNDTGSFSDVTDRNPNPTYYTPHYIFVLLRGNYYFDSAGGLSVRIKSVELLGPEFNI